MQKIMVFAILVTLNCSAYCHTGNPTASGAMPRVGMCAVDMINGVTVPFGTKVTLPDGTQLTVTDRFGGNKNNCLDVFMNTESECWQFGRQYLKCRVEIP